MSGRIEPSAWAKLPDGAQQDIVRQAQWNRHVRSEGSEDRLYDAILQHLGVDKDPAYNNLYKNYVRIHSEFPNAGSKAFVEEGLGTLSRAKPDDVGLSQLVKSIGIIRDTAMSVAEARASRGTSLAR